MKEKKYSRCECSECHEAKTLFTTHPQDEKGEILICTDCAYGIEYALGEMQSGLATQREQALCL
jgi:protein-arginine kinase activator protein McsA